MPLLQKHVEFLLDRFTHFSSLEEKLQDPEGPFSREWVRMTLETVVAKGSSHLTKVGPAFRAKVTFHSKIRSGTFSLESLLELDDGTTGKP